MRACQSNVSNVHLYLLLGDEVAAPHHYPGPRGPCRRIMSTTPRFAGTPNGSSLAPGLGGLVSLAGQREGRDEFDDDAYRITDIIL